MNFDGNNIVHYPSITNGSTAVEKCKKHCIDNKDCKFFAIYRSNKDKKNGCWLKSKVEKGVKDDLMITYAKPGNTFPTAKK